MHSKVWRRLRLSVGKGACHEHQEIMQKPLPRNRNTRLVVVSSQKAYRSIWALSSASRQCAMTSNRIAMAKPGSTCTATASTRSSRICHRMCLMADRQAWQLPGRHCTQVFTKNKRSRGQNCSGTAFAVLLPTADRKSKNLATSRRIISTCHSGQSSKKAEHPETFQSLHGQWQGVMPLAALSQQKRNRQVLTSVMQNAPMPFEKRAK